jgi:hypothetical protein
MSSQHRSAYRSHPSIALELDREQLLPLTDGVNRPLKKN